MEPFKEKISWLMPALLAYPLLTAALRFQRVKYLKRKFKYDTKESLASMTNDDAWKIQQTIAELEFPWTFEKAMQFALFRTYGIPTISKLLVKTDQLSSPKEATKRYADTGALITEFVGNPPTHPRTLEALARLNYLHGFYRRSGQILDDDMLYTLALFAIEPVKWIKRLEWRELEDFEKCALGTFWKAIGDAMLIEYDKLPSHSTGWKDGLHWLEEIWAWSEAYEDRCMVSNQYNKTTADQTTAILLWTVPPALKSVGLKVVSALMDDRLRTAMIYGLPPTTTIHIMNFIFSVRKFLLRNLSLPRPYLLRVHNASDSPSPEGRFFFKKYDALPYYVKPTFFNRWGPGAWISSIMGLPVPGDEDDTYYPNGYKTSEVGPKFFVGKGTEEAAETVKTLKTKRTGGCPFAVL